HRPTPPRPRAPRPDFEKPAVNDNARILKLSVASIKMDMRWWTTDIVVHLAVQTGNGYSADYEGRGNTGPTTYDAFNAANVALTESVIAMLKDPLIRH